MKERKSWSKRRANCLNAIEYEHGLVASYFQMNAFPFQFSPSLSLSFMEYIGQWGHSFAFSLTLHTSYCTSIHMYARVWICASISHMKNIIWKHDSRAFQYTQHCILFQRYTLCGLNILLVWIETLHLVNVKNARIYLYFWWKRETKKHLMHHTQTKSHAYSHGRNSVLQCPLLNFVQCKNDIFVHFELNIQKYQYIFPKSFKIF